MGPFADYSFSFDTYVGGTPDGIGVIPGPLDRPESTAPAENYAAGGPVSLWSTRNTVVSQLVDDVTRLMGQDFYELMLLDSEIGASTNTLVECVFADGITLSPRKVAMPETPTDEQPPAAEVAEAARAAEFCHRSLERVGRQPGSPTFERILALQYKYGKVSGHRLAEPRLELAEDGPDKGQYVLADYRLLTNRTWNFVIDRHGKLVGYIVFVADDEGRDAIAGDGRGMRLAVRFLRPDKFILFANEPHRGHPGGDSMLRPCWPGWTLKMTLMPIWHGYLQLFASAKVIIIAPPNSAMASLAGKSGENVDPAQRLLAIGVDIRSNSAAAFPNGTDVKLMEARSDGQPFKVCVDAVNRENSKAILGSNRATSEAEYGSRADSQTSKDILDLKVRCEKRGPAQVIEGLCFYLLEVNYGRAYAEQYCPIAALGDGGQEDFPQVAHAYAELFQAGILTPDQRPAISRRLRIPMPSAESVAKSVKAADAANNPDPGGVQTGQPPANSKPDPQPSKARSQEAA